MFSYLCKNIMKQFGLCLKFMKYVYLAVHLLL